MCVRVFVCPRWLQYHDKDTGNLPGALPLAVGMPVRLTEHIDRSEDKHLLRGTIGIVHSWVWNTNDPRPSIVYVKFPDAAWQLEGTEEPGLYPILPRSSDWYLDKGRKVKLLKVKRTQLPLTPAYAMTAHSSQGKTLPAVLVDLQVDKKVDPTLATVALTRVRNREDVLIMRPFASWLYQRGPTSDGPDLLLRKLRGEEIDWAAVREAKRPCATCQGCQRVLAMDEYDSKQWDLVRANKTALCRICKEGKAISRKRRLEPESLQKYQCFGCDTYKIAEAFPRAQLAQKDAETLRECLKCVQQKFAMDCCRCSSTKLYTDFEPEMVTMPPLGVVCLACQEEVRQQNRRQHPGFFKCRACGKIFGNPVAVGKERGQNCLNCASRAPWLKGVQTCRGCKRKFEEKPVAGNKRLRNCPDCRKK